MLPKIIIALSAFMYFALPALAQSPVITVTLTTSQTAPGALYLAPTPLGPGLTPTLLILDNQGGVIYQKPLAHPVLDFKRLPNGLMQWFDRTENTHNLLDNRFEQIGQLEAVGYEADGHDLQISPDGQRYLLMVYRDFEYDMSAFGGSPTATVTSCVIQELEPGGALVWAWDSFNHTPITHTNRSLTTAEIDYDHCNSLAYDLDGNILVSSRHLDSVTKINRQSGAVIWRLGGVANDFTFTNDPGFSLQHDARRLANGRLTIFDNGLAGRGYSRAVEYDLNEAARLITRTWEYTGPFAGCCGNVQTLDNGNRLINWGNSGRVTEVTPANTKALELTIGPPGFSYRAFRFLVVEPFFFPVIRK